MFFNAGSLTDGFKMLGSVCTTWNPEILINGGLLRLGIDIKDWIILLAGLAILLIMSIINERQDYRDVLAKRNLVVRWAILYAMIFMVIILGSYGPGYSAAEFIYQGF